jgi:hypothetical protein
MDVHDAHARKQRVAAIREEIYQLALAEMNDGVRIAQVRTLLDEMRAIQLQLSGENKSLLNKSRDRTPRSKRYR